MSRNTIAVMGLVALVPTKGLASGSAVAGAELHLASLDTTLEIARPEGATKTAAPYVYGRGLGAALSFEGPSASSPPVETQGYTLSGSAPVEQQFFFAGESALGAGLLGEVAPEAPLALEPEAIEFPTVVSLGQFFDDQPKRFSYNF